MKEFDKLKEIIDKLRSPDGCPWDKKQTHNSLLSFLYEESNEVGDAIIKNDKDELKEELGDLLLQIMLHSKIADENNDFNIKNVIDVLNEKLVRRHPHVFSDKTAENSDEVIKLWESVKKEEKINKKYQSILDKVPNNLSHIQRSYKLQKEASKVGFDWNNYNDIFNKIDEEIAELKQALKNNIESEIEHEIGDLFFALINLSRFLKIKPDVALAKVNIRFTERFQYIEKKLKEQNLDIEKCTIDQLEKLWQEAKIKLKKES